MTKALFYTILMMNILKKNKPSTMSFTCGLLTRFKTKCGEHPSSVGSESATQSSFLALHSLSDSIFFMRFPYFLYIFYEIITNPIYAIWLMVYVCLLLYFDVLSFFFLIMFPFAHIIQISEATLVSTD